MARTPGIFLLSVAVAPAAGLIVPARPAPRATADSMCKRGAQPCMGLFDTLAAAFENDDSLGEDGPAGLAKKAEVHTITWLGPPPANFFEKQAVSKSEVIAGQKLKDVADAAGVPIRWSCLEVCAPREQSDTSRKLTI
jgi:hypothetical protein